MTKFKQRAGYEPKTGDVFGYVATYMMAEAIARAGSTGDTEALINAMRGRKFSTLLGDVTIRDFDGQSDIWPLYWLDLQQSQLSVQTAKGCRAG